MIGDGDVFEEVMRAWGKYLVLDSAGASRKGSEPELQDVKYPALVLE